MPVQFSCPECNSVLRSSKPVAAGKMIRCPKCDLVFAPQVDEVEGEEEEELARPARQPARASRYDDDEDRDYDDEDDRPRRKKKKFAKKKKRSNSNVLVMAIVGGGVLLFLLAVGGVLGFVDIPGAEWTGFLRSYANKGPGDEELLAYVPADSDYVLSIDFAELVKMAPGLDQAVQAGFAECRPKRHSGCERVVGH